MTGLPRLVVWFAILGLSTTVLSVGPPVLGAQGAAAIDTMFQVAVAKGERPGVVAGVAKKDRSRDWKAVGRRDVGKNIPMTTDTVFRIASMTKPVTSAGIMMLYEQGKLRLDDPAGNYLPAYKGREVIASFNE